MQVLISIIVPVYKVEMYLPRCINSLVNQTYTNIEILLIDDGSPDNCPRMCDEFAQSDSRISVIHKANGGLSDARNAGIEASTGKYCIFVDADDYIDLLTCEKIVQAISLYNEPDVISYRGIKETENNKCIKRYNEHQFTNKVFTGVSYMKAVLEQRYLPVEAWLYAYKRSYLRESNLLFTKGLLHEDIDFTPRALFLANSVVCISDYLYHYINRLNSISTVKDFSPNARHIYKTCLVLNEFFSSCTVELVRKLIMDQCVVTYLSAFVQGKMYHADKKKSFIDKDFVRANAYRSKTRWKSFLFCISPTLYYCIHKVLHIKLKNGDIK